MKLLGCSRRSSRRGSVLVIVLVVVVLLTLTAYNYTQVMLTEFEAASQHQSEVQARQLADSGAEYVATLLANRTEAGTENLQQNPALFRGIVAAPSERARANGRFTIIAPLEQDPSASRVRYGLIDESAKLNINSLDKLPLSDEDARAWLMGLPNMTEEIADAIRDWIDSDDNRREYGAESEYYQSLSPPYAAKNGPMETIDELLLVRGVSPLLLYGEDANRNGLLDPNENDGEASPPLDDGDGVLQPGWVAYLTVHSREANLQASGLKKIDLNNYILKDLWVQLDEEFGSDVADYVIAYRRVGPDQEADPPPEWWTSPDDSEAAPPATGSPAAKVTTDTLANALSPGGSVTTSTGINLLPGGPIRVDSVWDLIDGVTKKMTDNEANPAMNKAFAAPGIFDSNSSSFASDVNRLYDLLTTGDDLFLEGRININQARREVLAGIPDMPADLVDAIVGAQSFDSDGAPADNVITSRATTAWLFTEGYADKWRMRKLGPRITTRGDVFRAQVLGYFDGGGPVSRLECIVDGTQFPPRVTFQRDLQDLGRGYTRAQLLPFGQ